MGGSNTPRKGNDFEKIGQTQGYASEVNNLTFKILELDRTNVVFLRKNNGYIAYGISDTTNGPMITIFGTTKNNKEENSISVTYLGSGLIAEYEDELHDRICDEHNLSSTITDIVFWSAGGEFI